jgi:CBS domain-containing protein
MINRFKLHASSAARDNLFVLTTCVHRAAATMTDNELVGIITARDLVEAYAK